jgi:hypothetical protein
MPARTWGRLAYTHARTCARGMHTAQITRTDLSKRSALSPPQILFGLRPSSRRRPGAAPAVPGWGWRSLCTLDPLSKSPRPLYALPYVLLPGLPAGSRLRCPKSIASAYLPPCVCWPGSRQFGRLPLPPSPIPRPPASCGPLGSVARATKHFVCLGPARSLHEDACWWGGWVAHTWVATSRPSPPPPRLTPRPLLPPLYLRSINPAPSPSRPPLPSRTCRRADPLSCRSATPPPTAAWSRPRSRRAALGILGVLGGRGGGEGFWFDGSMVWGLEGPRRAWRGERPGRRAALSPRSVAAGR